MRDYTEYHPSVDMNGTEPCFTCKYVHSLGFCSLHRVEVSAFDGCDKHEMQEQINANHR